MSSKDLSSTPISSTKQLLEQVSLELFRYTRVWQQPQTRTASQWGRPPLIYWAPGWDDVPIELYCHSTTGKCELFRVTRLIWDTELIPPILVQSIFIMLYEKGPRTTSKTTMPSTSFVMRTNSFKRLAQGLHIDLAEILSDLQEGFCLANGTRDNVCIPKWMSSCSSGNLEKK